MRNRRREESDSVHIVPVVRLPRGIYGFPPRLRTKLRYASASSLSITSTTGSVGKLFMSCNSIYDPDRTNAGHQPLYHDTFATVYNHYAVVDSTITVKYVNANADKLFNIGLNLEDNAAGTSTLDTAIEQSGGTAEVLGIVQSSRSVLNLTKTFSAVKHLGIDPFSSEEYKTPIGADPTEEYFFMIWCAETVAATGSVYLQVIVEYDVIFSELATPTQS